MNLHPDPGFWTRVLFMAGVMGILIGLALVTLSLWYYVGPLIAGLLVIIAALIGGAWKK